MNFFYKARTILTSCDQIFRKETQNTNTNLYSKQYWGDRYC